MGGRRGILRYRSKRYSRTGRDYRAELETDRSVRSVRMLGLFGFLWVNEVGGLRSCLFCDDVFAELADATFMDAWLPEYQADRRGNNLVISRNAEISSLLATLFDTGKCEGGRIAPDRIERSQITTLHAQRPAGSPLSPCGRNRPVRAEETLVAPPGCLSAIRHAYRPP